MKQIRSHARNARFHVWFNAVGMAAILVLFVAGLCAGWRERRRKKIHPASSSRQAARAA